MFKFERGLQARWGLLEEQRGVRLPRGCCAPAAGAVAASDARDAGTPHFGSVPPHTPAPHRSGHKAGTGQFKNIFKQTKNESGSARSAFLSQRRESFRFLQQKMKFGRGMEVTGRDANSAAAGSV